MATIKEATQNAMNFALEALGAERAKGLRLEEVESAVEGNVDIWRITLSMISPDQPSISVAIILAPPRREYKTFTVNRQSGEVTAMKMRELSNE